MVTRRVFAFTLLVVPAARLCAPAYAAQPFALALPALALSAKMGSISPVLRTRLTGQDTSSPSSQSLSQSLSTASAPGLSIAVADFSGADKELGRFLADTLLTDLTQSERLHMVERAEIGKALTELKLQSTGLAEPQDVKKVGRLLGADRLIVGSYLVREGQLIVNARLLDVRTGRVTPGGAANVTGSRDQMLVLVHQLAHRFHRRVTGADLLLENERVDPAQRPQMDAHSETIPDTPLTDNGDIARNQNPDGSAPATRAGEAAGRNSAQPSRSGGYTGGYNVREPETQNAGPALSSPITYSAAPPLYIVPPPFAPQRVVSSGDMARLLSRSGGREVTRFFTPGRDGDPISRLRALVALVKAGGFTIPLAAGDARSLNGLLPDAASVPLWAVRYVSVALHHGLWPLYRPLHPQSDADWDFVGGMARRLNTATQLARRGLVPNPSGRAGRGVVTQASIGIGARVTSASFPVRVGTPPIIGSTNDASQVVYTGLLIEARDLAVQRTMSARIVDTDGRQVYPDPNHVPDIDYVEDHGMADYYHNGGDARRAGDHPLVVRALGISGDAIVISLSAAARIREEERRDGFLRLWRVGILLDEGK